MSAVEEPQFQPCEPWITGDDVEAFCPSDNGSDTALQDSYALAVSEILFELSGRRFPGLCEITVRPCRVGCTCWDGWGLGFLPATVSWGWGWNGTYGAWDFGWWGGNGEECGCRPLSQVELAGYPVGTIEEILIDGSPLPLIYADGSPTFRVDYRNLLVRLNDPADPTVKMKWPACQNLALPTTEPGTWSVRYTWGQPPPEAGLLAAKQLACALLPGGVCTLPVNATKVTRQGVTIDRLAFRQWGLKDGLWQTGLPLVDIFLSAFNPYGIRRQALVWSPDTEQKPRHAGES